MYKNRKLTYGILILWIGASLTILGFIKSEYIEKEKMFTEEESKGVALNFVKNSPTYQFDGIENSIEHINTLYPDMPYTWEFIFEFRCRHAGYGNRSGKMLAQVITPHTAHIIVKKDRVISATLDGKWNIMTQKSLEKEKYCVKNGTDKKLSLSEAKEIARNSECGKKGNLENKYSCNENSGTWWIDLDIEKEGCNPACVVDVSTKQAKINWRCTGLITEEFCGWSTKGNCSSNSDCIKGGCSSQVCQSRNEEPVTTTCEYRECYSAEKYGLSCKCIDNKCQWS